ncbi:hypothetical protein B9T62_37640 [Paenibacillus donghaensis]|uniref:Transposase IS4-like domain-containing protein n=1 Tax=Paenibacillus donghaensis TaxID=414771 RepID=A0A2Z2KYY0_9BACL|nr:hypothetical protein B9T62_37640 [Paenibacillus donghaensis]
MSEDGENRCISARGVQVYGQEKEGSPGSCSHQRWDITALEVAQLYRYRWKVELFFKCMKSNLHLKKIYSSRNPEAVWNLIYLYLIAYVLCEELRLCYAPKQRIGRVLAVFRLYIKGTLADFLKHLNRPKERTSKGRRNKGGRPATHPKVLKPKPIQF